MRLYFLAVTLILSCVGAFAANNQGFLVPTTMKPITPLDTYATHEAQYGKGGLRSVATLSNMSAISQERREPGMMVSVTSVDKIFRLVSSCTENRCWRELPAGGASRFDQLGGSIYDSSSAASALSSKKDTSTFNAYSAAMASQLNSRFSAKQNTFGNYSCAAGYAIVKLKNGSFYCAASSGASRFDQLGGDPRSNTSLGPLFNPILSPIFGKYSSPSNPGWHQHFVDFGNYTSTIHVYVPQGYVKNKPQKWVHITHGGTEDPADYFYTGSPYFTESDKYNILLVGSFGGHTDSTHWPWLTSTANPNTRLHDAIDYIKSLYHLHDYLPSIYGVSMGGGAAIYEMLNYPYYWSAFAASCPVADLTTFSYQQSRTDAVMGGAYPNSNSTINSDYVAWSAPVIGPNIYIPSDKKLWIGTGALDTIKTPPSTQFNPVLTRIGFSVYTSHLVPTVGHADVGLDYMDELFQFFSSYAQKAIYSIKGNLKNSSFNLPVQTQLPRNIIQSDYFTINDDNRTITFTTNKATNPAIQIESTNTNGSGGKFYGWHDKPGNAALTTGDQCYNFGGGGSDGTNVQQGAGIISIRANAPWTSTDHQSAWVFFGVNSGNTTTTEWMRLANGNAGIGTTTPTSKLHVVGDGYFTGNVSASNLSGTNTGDQDLSPYQLISGMSSASVSHAATADSATTATSASSVPWSGVSGAPTIPTSFNPPATLIDVSSGGYAVFNSSQTDTSYLLTNTHSPYRAMSFAASPSFGTVGIRYVFSVTTASTYEVHLLFQGSGSGECTLDGAGQIITLVPGSRIEVLKVSSTDFKTIPESGGSSPVAGDGITVTGSTVAVDSSVVRTSRTINGHALSSNVTVTASDVSLGSVTNDTQTKATIMPNTAPSAGQIPVGNAEGTAYAPVTMGGDCTISSTASVTCTKSSGTAFGTGAFATIANYAPLVSPSFTAPVHIGGTQSYPLDVSGLQSSSITPHIHASANNSDDGLYIGSSSASASKIFSGATWVTNTLTAKGTTASGIAFSGGSIFFYANTSLTAGSTYTPTNAFTVSPTGVAVNAGTNIVYYCNGGVSVGNLCRGNGCSCVAGSWVATGLKLD